jgi:hypothetical protein
MAIDRVPLALPVQIIFASRKFDGTGEASGTLSRFQPEVWSNFPLHGSDFTGKDFVESDSATGSGRFKHGPRTRQIPQTFLPVDDWSALVADRVQPVELRQSEAVFKTERNLRVSLLGGDVLLVKFGE